MQNFDSSMKQNKCERGKKMQVVIEIPKEVLYDTKQTIEQATDFAKSVTALGFYKQYGVSVELWFPGCWHNRERIFYQK